MANVEDFAIFMQEHPHNTDCGDKFMDLVWYCYNKDKSAESLEEFINHCLDTYGGTVAGAMIDYIINH